MNRNTSLLILLFTLNTLTAIGQSIQLDPFKNRIKKSAEKMAHAYEVKDYKTVIKYFDTQMVTALGGKKKAIGFFKKGLPGGAEIYRFEIDTPSNTIVSQGTVQCTLIETITLQIKDAFILTKSTLIGISKDGGKNWFFIDAARPIKELKCRFPYISDRLIIAPDPPIIRLR